jgi:hypothetical protein
MAVKLKKFITSSIAEYSAELIKPLKLPYGTELRLFDTKRNCNVRHDKIVKYRRICVKSKAEYDETGYKLKNVKDVLRFANFLLTTKLDSTREFRLYAPDGNRLDGGIAIKNLQTYLPNEVNSDTAFEQGLLLEVLTSHHDIDLSVKQARQVFQALNNHTNGGFADLLIEHIELDLSDDDDDDV